LGRQELEAEILTDTPGALWRFEMIDAARIPAVDRGLLQRIVLGVDPAVTAHEGSDETGIVVCGVDQGGTLYVLEDASLRASPEQWARRAIALYRKWGADRIVAESNQGGDLVESVLRAVDRNVSFTAVRATRGKYLRAEPIAALYEQGRAKHCGKFGELEEQMMSWAPGDTSSPDRLDALVWAATHLVVREMELQIFL
jgi:phage terminase large subunit-like protein